MNFFAHAYVASQHDAAPGFVLGAMLPDFASMLGMRWGGFDSSTVREGIALHHRTDAAFHATPTFIRLNVEGRRELEGAGVRRGPAMALAHVGLELVLDGLLAQRHELTAYRSALQPEVARDMEWRRPAERDAYESLRVRLLDSPLPQAYVDSEFTAERLQRILGRRPRLRPGPRAHQAVLPWLERLTDDDAWTRDIVAETLTRM